LSCDFSILVWGQGFERLGFERAFWETNYGVLGGKSGGFQRFSKVPFFGSPACYRLVTFENLRSGASVTSIYLDHLLEQDISEMVETLDAVFAEPGK
jgi:hypothetical protein